MSTTATAATTAASKANELPTVETFRTDLTSAEIDAAAAANTRAIASQAYLYALPAFMHMRQMIDFIQARRYLSPNEFPMGGWMLVRGLSDPTTRTVMPNVDTLYGANYMLLDQQGPVVLSIPPIKDRYFSVAMLDAYLNNFAIVSPRTYGTDGGCFLIVPPGWSGEAPPDMTAVIHSPTPCMVLFERIFTRNPSEYDELHRLQDAITVTPLAQWGKPDRAFPPVDISAFDIQNMRMTRDPLQYFAYTNYYTGRNPGPAEDAGLLALFRSAGVGPGSALPEAEHLRAAIAAGAKDAQAAINGVLSAGPFRNGWRVPAPDTGRAGPHILSRAAVQIYQFGSFVPEEATYFFAFKDGADRTLHGDQRYVLRFAPGQLPPLNPPGFWSVTMYTKDGYLFDNPINRYIIRPDMPGLTYDADGGLTIPIQADQPVGAAAANWLPVPRDVFFIALRAYLPQQPVLDGTWFPPALEQVK